MSLKRIKLFIMIAFFANTDLMAMDPPKKDQISAEQEALLQKAFLDYGIFTTCGKHHTDNEDTHLCLQLPHEGPGIFLLAAVFDGHGGSRVSRWLENNFGILFEHSLTNALSLKESLINSFILADQNVKPFKNQGSCALVCVICNRELVIAHAGDTRAVIYLNDGNEQNKLYTNDHTPANERQRIEEAGGKVISLDDILRIDGEAKLAVPRSIGDYRSTGTKDLGLSCEPSILERTIDSSFKFIIIASDGIWNVVSNDDAISIVKKILSISNARNAAKKLVEYALSQGSGDDLTAIVIKL